MKCDMGIDHIGISNKGADVPIDDSGKEFCAKEIGPQFLYFKFKISSATTAPTDSKFSG